MQADPIGIVLDKNPRHERVSYQVDRIVLEKYDGWKPSSHTYKKWIKDLRDILQEEYDKRFNTTTK